MDVMRELWLLGYPVKDKVTGFTGIVSTIGFDLYGCVQAIVQPLANDKGDVPDAKWFDTKRLSVTGERAMMPPDFVPTSIEPNGPTAKPMQTQNPLR